jgi:hypothetical protein
LFIEEVLLHDGVWFEEFALRADDVCWDLETICRILWIRKPPFSSVCV